MLEYIGKTVEEAAILAGKAGQEIRIVKKNGESLIGTCDYWTNRVNVEVVDGVVTAIVGIG